MRKLFVTREDNSFFSVADIFGYIIAFFILWLLVLGYRTVSKVTSKASSIASEQLETVKNALPSKDKAEQILEMGDNTKGEEKPTVSLIPQIIPELSDKALDFVSNTSSTASKLLTKDGAKDTISSINSYLNGIIFSVADDVEELKSKDSNRNEQESKKDSLSSF